MQKGNGKVFLCIGLWLFLLSMDIIVIYKLIIKMK